MTVKITTARLKNQQKHKTVSCAWRHYLPNDI